MGAVTGTEGYRKRAEAAYGGKCHRCDRPTDFADIEVHHADRSHDNDNLDNLECLCGPCHHEEHHSEDPMWRLVVSMPRSVMALLDEVVEDNDMNSRSEAVNRAVVAHYEREASEETKGFTSAGASVSAWFDDDRHTRWVSDLAMKGAK